MNRQSPWRIPGIALCAVLMLLAAALFARLDAPSTVRDPAYCLGVPILTADEASALTRSDSGSSSVLLNGQPAPCDEKSRTLYIPVSLTESTEPCDLTGKLAPQEMGASLAFAPDPAFGNLSAAIADGHAFSLLAFSDQTTAAELSVVFTPLPVVCMTTTDGSDYADPYIEHSGIVSVFEPGSSAPQISHSGWHRRGMTTRLFKKGSWKLSLTNAFGKSRNFDFAGLGADDDWILNSMGMDDLKLREKLIMDLWNSMQKDTSYRMRMSDGEYAEVVLDGEYLGLYLLQRRVDAKYLGLSKSRDIVLKGANLTVPPASALEAFTIKDSPLTAARTYALSEGLFSLSDLSALDIDNFIDMELFVLFGALYDNLNLRNAYYIFSPEEGEYRSYLLPWDTDLAFGLRFVEGQGYVLLNDHETALPFEHRREYEAMKALYPDLNARIAARWQALRKDALSDDAIFSALHEIKAAILTSGAFARDRALWGTRYGEDDTFDALESCIKNRLAQLDAMYIP